MKATKRDLVGRKVVAVDFQPFDPVNGTTPVNILGYKTAYDPILTLDNGRKLWFTVQETEIGEYGVEIQISEREGQKRG